MSLSDTILADRWLLVFNGNDNMKLFQICDKLPVLADTTLQVLKVYFIQGNLM
jgi:hypothetical protein